MFRACPFCRPFKLPCPPSRRSASTLQKRVRSSSRQPSRMILSPIVSHGPPKKPTRGGKTPGRDRHGPFGGMNRTQTPRDMVDMAASRATRQPKESRPTRPARGARGPKKAGEAMKALKMQRALAVVSYDKRTRIKQEMVDASSFDQLSLLPLVRDSIPTQALPGLAHLTPTPIQRLAIPALITTDDRRARRRKRKADVEGAAADSRPQKEMQQFLLAAETGSGKTLAYLLPVIDAVKRAETADQNSPDPSSLAQSNLLFDSDLSPPQPPVQPARPRAIILLPTAELVAQVGRLVKALAHTVKFRAALLSTAYSTAVIRSRLRQPAGLDILVTTPHLLHSITESDPNILARVSHLVIDEADSLLDRSFSPITSALVDRATPSLEQLILCSATIPRSLDTFLHRRFPAIRRLVTPNLHAIPRRVQLSVVDIDKVPFQGNRDLACAQTVWDIGEEHAGEPEPGDAGGSDKKIVVFVNEREKTTQLAEYLRSKGVDATALSRDSDGRRQAETLAAFTGTGVSSTSEGKPDDGRTIESAGVSSSSPLPTARRTLSRTRVLVTTDLGSRGIDTLPVRHVILYDVPHTSIDFIHRLGRVGRMGRRGRGVVLVGKNDRRDVVREVRESMFGGRALI